MKKRTGLIAVLLVCMVQAVFAQSLDDAKKNLYYEKFTTAKQQLQQITSSKGDADAYYYLGLADIGLGDYDAAKADFQKGLQADSKSALNTVGMGAIDIQDKNYDAAKQKFQQAVDLSEGRNFDVIRAILDATSASPKADAQFALDLVTQFKDNKKNRKYTMTAADQVAIGNVYANLPSGGGEAASSYENAQTLDPKYAAAFYEEGNLYDRARQDSLALQYWNSAIAADPNYAPAYNGLFSYYRNRVYQTYSLDDVNKAQEYLNKYLALTDDKVNAQVNAVDLLFMQRKYQDAVTQAQQLMNTATNDETKTRLYKLMAVSQEQMGDSVDAKQSMDMYFQRQDSDKVVPFDYQLYSDILFKLNQTDLGNQYLQKAVNSDTTSDLAYIRSQAQILREKGNWKGAALWYKKAIDVNKGAPSSYDYFYYPYSLFVAQDYQGAEQGFTTMTQKLPDQPSGYYWLGRSQQAIDTGFTGAAINAYNQYLEKMKTDTSAQGEDHKTQLNYIYSYLGGYYFNTKKDYATAATYAQKLVDEVDPKSPVAQTIYYNLAHYYTSQKDRDNAMLYMNKLQAIDPSNEGLVALQNYWKQLDEYEAKMKKYNEAKKKASGG